ncbi:MAG: hypothetical protein H0U74_15605 [Bradymonadaceae bacterium]|nr:hypothetical protein [Lujinxingiaceae bacterium]
MYPSRQRLRRLFLTLALLVLAVGMPFSAFAEGPQNLAKMLPEGNKMLLGVDVNALRPSPFYGEVMTWVRSQSNLGELLDLLQREGGFDVDKDLTSIALGSPELPGNVEEARKMPYTVVLSGAFDVEKVTTAAKKRFPSLTERKEGSLAVFRAEAFELSFLNAKTLMIVTGKPDYQQRVWKTVGAKPSARNTQFNPILADVGSKHSIWLLMDTAKKMEGQAGPKALMSALALRLASGLNLTMLTYMATEADASQAVVQTESLKAEAAANPMASMLGLAPLIRNLAIKQDKSKVWVTSSMTEPEARTIFARVRQIAERSQNLKAAPAPSSKTKIESAPAEKAPKKGAPADFN